VAEAQGEVGQAEEGLHTLAEAAALVAKTGERYYEAELYRLKGELTLKTGDRLRSPAAEKEAEAYFHMAIGLARRQQAKSLELRAVMSLVRLRQQQAQHASRSMHRAPRARLTEAHRMLVDLSSWFTEGFETKDLQDAKALLDVLA
jgi:predicted ATPase